MGTSDSLQGLAELFQCKSAKKHNYMGVAVQIEDAEALDNFQKIMNKTIFNSFNI